MSVAVIVRQTDEMPNARVKTKRIIASRTINGGTMYSQVVESVVVS